MVSAVGFGCMYIDLQISARLQTSFCLFLWGKEKKVREIPEWLFMAGARSLAQPPRDYHAT